MQAIQFTNFSNETFTHAWDKQEYTFQPGQTIYLQDYLAKHFAKHLIDRELNKIDKRTNDQLSRQAMMSKCFGNASDAMSALKAETEAINLNQEEPKIEEKVAEPVEVKDEKFCDSCDSKGVRHLKACPKSRESLADAEVKEESFEGLQA